MVYYSSTLLYTVAGYIYIYIHIYMSYNPNVRIVCGYCLRLSVLQFHTLCRVTVLMEFLRVYNPTVFLVHANFNCYGLRLTSLTLLHRPVTLREYQHKSYNPTVQLVHKPFLEFVIYYKSIFLHKVPCYVLVLGELLH